jgi:hypothetical protein
MNITNQEYLVGMVLQALIQKQGSSWDEEGLYCYDNLGFKEELVSWEEVVRQAKEIVGMV